VDPRADLDVVIKTLSFSARPVTVLIVTGACSTTLYLN